PCSTSMDELSRGFGVSAVAVVITAPVIFRRLGLGWLKIFMSLAGQLLLVGFFAVTLPGMDVGMADRSRQKRTMADMRTIADDLRAIKNKTGTFPQVRSILALQSLTKHHLPLLDAWGRLFIISTTQHEYMILSLGACGQRDVRPRSGAVSPRG